MKILKYIWLSLMGWLCLGIQAVDATSIVVENSSLTCGKLQGETFPTIPPSAIERMEYFEGPRYEELDDYVYSWYYRDGKVLMHRTVSIVNSETGSRNVYEDFSYLGTIHGNRIVFTHQTENGHHIEGCELTDFKYKLSDPWVVTYSPSEKVFYMDGIRLKPKKL